MVSYRLEEVTPYQLANAGDISKDGDPGAEHIPVPAHLAFSQPSQKPWIAICNLSYSAQPVRLPLVAVFLALAPSAGERAMSSPVPSKASRRALAAATTWA